MIFNIDGYVSVALYFLCGPDIVVASLFVDLPKGLLERNFCVPERHHLRGRLGADMDQKQAANYSGNCCFHNTRFGSVR
ncbi:hypothetical protein D3C73_816690 [compost metagenome]